MEDNKQVKSTSDSDNQLAPKPDAGTLHTTDPQENMEGPVSSTIQKTGEAFDTGKSKEEADREHEKNY